MSDLEPDDVYKFWQGYDEARFSLREIEGCRQCWVEGWLSVFDQYIKDRGLLSPYSQGQEAAHLDALFFCKKHVCGKEPLKVDPHRRVRLEPPSS